MIEELKSWKTDVPAGLVVFLVAIPLCLGIALASGAPALAGIIAGIVGGLIVTIFSDSHVGVSGPAAGLVAIVVVAIEDLGFEHFLLAVVVGGVIQLILGFLRAGTIGYYFPTAVIKGMLVAIGLIIVLKQIPHAFGYDKDYEGDLAFAQEDGFNTFSELIHALQLITPGAIVIAGICLAILIVWETDFIKKFSASQIVQGPLVAVVAGILLNLLFQRTGMLALGEGHSVQLPTTGFWSELQMPSFDQIGNPAIYVTGLTLAVVASIESLLCAEATDKLDPQRRQTSLNRELKAQGIGNIVSGMIGGLPVTQVIVRSSTNIQSGAQSRLSAFVHGLFLLICVASIPGILNLIPLASLAAVLLVVGYKLAHPSKFIDMYKLGWTQFLPFVITIGAILTTDLLIGIGIGLVVSVFFVLKNNYVKSFWISVSETEGTKVHRMVLAENVFFMNKGAIQAALKDIEPGSKLIIDASDTVFIDQDVVDIIHDFETNAQFHEVEVERIDFVPVSDNKDPARVRRLGESA